MRFSLYLTLAGLATLSTAAETKPNFSGIWKLYGATPPQITIIDQNETELRVFQFIGDRLSLVKGPIDGQPHAQTVDGPASGFLARWQGDSLFVETKREPSDSATPAASIRYLMRLAADGKTMSVKRANLAPPSPTVHEKWEKQDPLARDAFLTGFDGRLKLDDPSANLSAAEANHLRGLVAYAFNDVPQAVREYMAILKQEPASTFRDEARANLAEIYARNGLMRQAEPYFKFADRMLYRKLASYPEISVAHREYARVQASHDSEGRLLLPVAVAGQDASFMVDTGSNNSLLRASEARRLGLKLEPARLSIVNGMVKFEARLAIVPALTVGATRLENAPLWVVPDERLDWPGVLGIDLLLKLETLRFSASGDAEIGFPSEPKNMRNANICFWHNAVLADVSSHGQSGMVFILDTGSNRTEPYPRFAARLLDFVSANATKSLDNLNGLGGHRDLGELLLPELSLGVFGGDAALQPAHILLEKSPMNNQLHGEIGMDLLNSAQRVTLDFQAMRLTME